MALSVIEVNKSKSSLQSMKASDESSRNCLLILFIVPTFSSSLRYNSIKAIKSSTFEHLALLQEL